MRMRSRGRVLAMQALYCTALHSDFIDDDLAEEANCFLEEAKQDQQGLQFALLITQGVLEHIARINEIIRLHIHRWQLSRLLEIDKAILRLSIYSLLHLSDIPVAVTINEAVELAKQYGSEHSPQFINGVLDACAKKYCIASR